MPDPGVLFAPERIAPLAVGFLLATALFVLTDGSMADRPTQRLVAGLSVTIGVAFLALDLAPTAITHAGPLGLAVLLGIALLALQKTAGPTVRLVLNIRALFGLVGISWTMGAAGLIVQDPRVPMDAMTLAPFGLLAPVAIIAALDTVAKKIAGAGWLLAATIAWALAALAATAHAFGFQTLQPATSLAALALAMPFLHLNHVARCQAEQAAQAHHTQALEGEHAQRFAVIAHQIRSPLGVLLVGLANLRRKLPDDESIRRIGRLTSAAQRIDSLIDRHGQLLQLIRSDFEPALSPQGPDYPALSALHLQREAHPQHVFTHVGPGTSAEPVLIDTKLVTLALTNLLDNAARYAVGSAPIELETTLDADAIQYRIVNPGPPLPQNFALMASGLDPHETATHAAKCGLGLGLSLAAHVARIHGGSLTGQSAASLTTVTLTIPVRHARSGAQERQ